MTAPDLSVSNKKLLQEVTRRIVASVQPRRVLLFGSAARGRMNKDSDLDMLVVMRGSLTAARPLKRSTATCTAPVFPWISS